MGGAHYKSAKEGSGEKVMFFFFCLLYFFLSMQNAGSQKIDFTKCYFDVVLVVAIENDVMRSWLTTSKVSVY